MSDETAVIAAWIGAIAAGAGAVVAWFKERALNQEKAAFESSLEGYKHTLGLEAEKLKAQLQAGLTTLEARERLRADLRLRILAADEERLEEQIKLFRRCLELAVNAVTHAQSDNPDKALATTPELAQTLTGIGLLLPPELRAAAEPVRSALAALVASVGSPAGNIQGKFGKVTETIEAFDRAAQAWRERVRAELLEK